MRQWTSLTILRPSVLHPRRSCRAVQVARTHRFTRIWVQRWPLYKRILHEKLEDRLGKLPIKHIRTEWVCTRVQESVERHTIRCNALQYNTTPHHTIGSYRNPLSVPTLLSRDGMSSSIRGELDKRKSSWWPSAPQPRTSLCIMHVNVWNWKPNKYELVGNRHQFQYLQQTMNR